MQKKNGKKKLKNKGNLEQKKRKSKKIHYIQ